MAAHIIVLRAPPGSGKTSVSHALQTRLKPAFRVSVDTVRYFMQPRQRDGKQMWLAKVGIFECAMHYSAQGIPCIIESVFEDTNLLEVFAWKAERARIPFLVFTLCTDVETTLERNRSRDIYYAQSEARVRELFETYDWTYGHTIDTTQKIVEEVAEDIEEWCARHLHPPPESEYRYVAFVRNGEPDRSAEVYRHESEIGLTPRGRAQCAYLGRTLGTLDAEVIVHSPFRRTRETAHEMAAAMRCDVLVEDRLREREFAALYGWSRETIERHYSREFADALTLAGAESLADAQRRVVEATLGLVSRYQCSIVVSHGGPHSWLCSHLLKMPLENHRSLLLEPGCYSLFRFKKDASFDKVIALNSSGYPSQ